MSDLQFQSLALFYSLCNREKEKDPQNVIILYTMYVCICMVMKIQSTGDFSNKYYSSTLTGFINLYEHHDYTNLNCYVGCLTSDLLSAHLEMFYS